MAGIERYLGLSVEQLALAGLAARFKGGPKRRKPVKTTTKKPLGGKAGPRAKTKPKQRLRDRRNIGKRRQPSGKATAEPEGAQGVDAGFEPPKRRT